MKCYVDSSVILRVLLGEARPLPEWRKIKQAYASRLLAVEVGRTIDRCRLAGDINDAEVEQLHGELARLLRSLSLIGLTGAILERAAAAMPTVLGSLDAIHLASAMELERSLGERPVLATHDAQLARAARASGFTVVGG